MIFKEDPARVILIHRIATSVFVGFFAGTIIWGALSIVNPIFTLTTTVHAVIALIAACFRICCDIILKRRPIRLMINKIVLLFAALTHSRIVLTYINGGKITTRIHGNLSSEDLEAMKDFMTKTTMDVQAKMAVQTLKETIS